MRFKRKSKIELHPCPRCAQLVEEDVSVCPLCGWDVSEMYYEDQHSAAFTAATVAAQGKES
jgi:hypothetical protein